jgi:hypothetical protein
LVLLYLPACSTSTGDDDDTATASPTATPTTEESPTPTAVPTATATGIDFPTPATNSLTAEVLGTCSGDASSIYSGTLRCPDDTPEGIRWDLFRFEASEGDCISVAANNQGTGAADLAALIWDVAGNFYGLSVDYTQLDDEIACSVPPWDGFACPAADLIAQSTGVHWLAVFQWGGGCSDPADYQAEIAVGGVDIDMTNAPTLNDRLIGGFQ